MKPTQKQNVKNLLARQEFEHEHFPGDSFAEALFITFRGLAGALLTLSLIAAWMVGMHVGAATVQDKSERLKERSWGSGAGQDKVNRDPLSETELSIPRMPMGLKSIKRNP